MGSNPIVQGFLTQWAITQGYESNMMPPPGGAGTGGTVYTTNILQQSPTSTVKPEG